MAGGRGDDPMGRSPSMVNQPNMGRGANAYVMEMRKRIDQYFDIVLRNIRDSVPKAIGCFLVKKSQDVLQFELYNQVNSNPHLAQALGEPARITERRNALTAVLKTLKNSLKVLQRDPDISANTIGDEELEATLRQEAMEKRNQSMAGGPQRGGQPSNFDDLQKMNQGGNEPRRTGMHRGPPPGHPDYRGPPPGHPDYRGPPPG